jgi:hypothetical protein
MRRPVLIVAFLLCVALVLGTATLGSPQLEKPGTIRVSTRTVSKRFINRGPRGRSPGDVLITRQLLYNRGITPKSIGHSDLACTYTAPYARLCSGSFTFPKGKIVVAGSATYRQFYELAVIGGTGLYDNVRGSMTVTLLARKPTRELLLFRLVV